MTIAPAFAAFRRAMFRWDVALAVRCVIAFVGLAIILSGCNDPTAPDYRTFCEPGCTEAVAVPLSTDDTRYWMRLAREEVQAQADRGEIRLSTPLNAIADPSVEWRPCPWMQRGYDTPGGPVRNICSAGSTDADAKLIRVSTWERDRRGPLVKHEARNYFWQRTGNGRLAY